MEDMYSSVQFARAPHFASDAGNAFLATVADHFRVFEPLFLNSCQDLQKSRIAVAFLCNFGAYEFIYSNAPHAFCSLYFSEMPRSASPLTSHKKSFWYWQKTWSGRWNLHEILAALRRWSRLCPPMLAQTNSTDNGGPVWPSWQRPGRCETILRSHTNRVATQKNMSLSWDELSG